MSRPTLIGSAGALLAAALAAATAAPALADAFPSDSSSQPAAVSADATGGPAETLTAAAPRSPGRFFVHLSLGMNAYTYLGATGTAPSGDVTPNKSMLLFEQIGFGYYALPSLRLQLTLMAGEAATGNPAGQSSFKVGTIIPWAVYLHGGFFGGAGPLFAPRFYGKDQMEYGLFTCAGYAFRIGKTGLAVAPAVQAPMVFNHRFSFAVTPAVVLGDRL